MSHISKIETIQAKILRTIVNAPWYVRNEDILKDLGIPAVKEEICKKVQRKNSNAPEPAGSGNEQHNKH